MKFNVDTQSIVLINSGNPENTHFATGFIIYHDSEWSYVVTCAHIFNDLHWQADMKVDGHSRGTFVSDSELDLAIMQVKGLFGRKSIKLGDYGRAGSPFTTTGFSLYGKHYSLRSIEGVLEQNVELVSSNRIEKGARSIQGLNVRVPAWSVKILDETPLQAGFSGAPVIEKESGVCVGVMSYRQSDGRTGLAISIEALNILLVAIGLPTNIIEKLFDDEKRDSHLDRAFHRATHLLIMGELQDSLELFQQIKIWNPLYPRIEMMINSVKKELDQRYVRYGRVDSRILLEKVDKRGVEFKVELKEHHQQIRWKIRALLVIGLFVLIVLAVLGYFLLRWWPG